VGELIQELSKLDPDKEMFVSYVDHTDYQYRTPLRLNEIRELNVGIEREVDRDDEGEYDVDWVDTNIVDIEMVEFFKELLVGDDDEAPF
jgi:hypothetical protein